MSVDLKEMDQAGEKLMRIIQETVPGKQITMAHIISTPNDIIYQKLGLDPKINYQRAAIGVMTLTPYEMAIIAADLAIKASRVVIGFIDRFSGTLLITGSITAVNAAFEIILRYAEDKLGFSVCRITKA